MTPELLTRVGLNWRFGYKTVSPTTGDRCFFRFLDGKWHDVRAPHDFGYLAPQAIEILGNEMQGGNVLMVFACCCTECTKNPQLKTALDQLLASGVPADDVTHGYWPEHTAAETKRFETELAQLMPVAEFRRLVGLAHNELEVRRLVLYHRDNLTGTAHEICEALDFASARAMHFDGPADGIAPKSTAHNPQPRVSALRDLAKGGHSPKSLVPGLALAALMVFGMQDRLEAGSSVGLISQSTRVQIPAPATTSALFSALGQLETGDNDHATGAAHEVSRFQITPPVWRQYASTLPLSSASNPVTAWNVVCAAMAERVARFEAKYQRPPTVLEWYVLYSRPAVFLGDGARHLSSAERDRAERFENLYQRQEASRRQTGAGFAGNQRSDIQSLHKNRLHFPTGGV